MAFVDGMVLTRCLLPVIVRREEGIGLSRYVVNLSKAEAVGDRKEVAIEGGSANDEHLLVGKACNEELVPRGEALASWQLPAPMGEHAVTTVGQCSLGQALKGSAPHKDGVASGECLETLQVVGQPVDKFVLIAYSAVPGHGCNHANHMECGMKSVK